MSETIKALDEALADDRAVQQEIAPREESERAVTFIQAGVTPEEARAYLVRYGVEEAS